ncbi:MAG: serine dehydratase subunit alpha family protein [Candidatus Limivicinus sp.]
MNRTDREYQNYVSILKEELLPAMGCTEPVAVAYAAAKGREVLGCLPERCMLYVSGNIIKNVKSVVVPNTGGLKGLKAAAAAGIVVGKAELQMSVVAETRPEEIPGIQQYIDEHEIQIQRREGDSALYIEVLLEGEGHSARVIISDFHTNIILIEKDGQVIFEKEPEQRSSFASDHSLMSLEGMWDFINSVEIADISELLDSQIRCNSAISQEGLDNPWGAQIGRILLSSATDTKTRAMARAAAGSDARMSGCEKPVVIVGGSGNQGLTVTMPVLEYAERLGSSREQVYRALALANLMAVYLKKDIGRLSAYCTAVTAGVGAGCAVAYLDGGTLEAIRQTIVNDLAVLSGMFCDGAKPSCAAKVANSVSAGIMGYEMYKNGQNFNSGDGFLQSSADDTIDVVAELARVGMAETEEKILNIMVSTSNEE